MSTRTRDMLRFLLVGSQADAAMEHALSEAGEIQRLETKRSPLVKALKAVGIDGSGVTVDELGARLILPDAQAWHDAVTKLGSVEAMNALASEGWVSELAGDVADTTEPSEYTINFLCVHDAEPSEQDKATPSAAFNKEFKDGSDAIVPKDQAARDKERVAEASEPKRGSYTVNAGKEHTFASGLESALKKGDALARRVGAKTFFVTDGISARTQKFELDGDTYRRASDQSTTESKIDEDTRQAADALLEDAAGEHLKTEGQTVSETQVAAILQAAEDVSTPARVAVFFRALAEAGIAFHPDTAFDTYESQSGARIFTEEQAVALDSAMATTFGVDGVNPYEDSTRALRKAMGLPTADEALKAEGRRIVDGVLAEDDKEEVALDSFADYLKNVSDKQVQGVYDKEKAAGRRPEMRLAKAEARARGITIDEGEGE